MHISETTSFLSPLGKLSYLPPIEKFDFSKFDYWSKKERTGIGFKYINDTPALSSIVVCNKTFKVPTKFVDLLDEISFSKELLEFQDNWDSQGGRKMDERLYLSALNFLIEYTLYIDSHYNVQIEAPEINLCPNGSIDLSWRTKLARLLVNVKYKDDTIVANFYGDNHSNKLPRQGVLDINNVDESFALWMKVLS